MTARHLLSLSIASCAVAAAAPALAQPEMTYEPGQYDYARPAPVQPTVIYQQQPVVQPIPQGYVEDDAYEHGYEDAYEVEEVYRSDPYPGHAQPYPMHHAGPPIPPQPAFDREAWLDQCRAQYRDYRDNRGRRDGGIGGGILGAAVGGVIGNRVADGDRLAGTLIGAGVGGIAGAVLGSAIGGSSDRRREARAADECEAWLDRYLAGGYGHAGYGQGYGQGYYGYGYGYPGYGYGYAMHMTYVPVLVAVPQRAVVRETVTEEWVEVERTHTRPVKKVHYHPVPAPAPKPAKTKYAKQR